MVLARVEEILLGKKFVLPTEASMLFLDDVAFNEKKQSKATDALVSTWIDLKY